MKLFLDNNVVLDIFLRREPFFHDSYEAVRRAIENEDECFISATAATDIFYILRKSLQSSEKAKEYINALMRLALFSDVTCNDISDALSADMPDFEDAVLDAVAKRNNADYIITRNTKDFVGSNVCAITPTDFLTL